MFRSILVIVVLLSTTLQKKPGRTATITRQPCVWDSTENWRIYKVNNFRRVFAISTDSMKFIESVPFNSDSLHSMLCTSEKIDINGPLWMGCYLASYQTLNGGLVKVIISQYGGFFFLPQKNQYFQLEQSLRKDWLTYLSNYYMKMEH